MPICYKHHREGTPHVVAALYPLDTIKTRLQTATSGGGLRALWRSGGGKALYSGILGNLAGVVPASAIFMGVYEPVKTAVERRVPENRQFLGSLSGGVTAGLAASFVRVPTEVIKQRMQTGACIHAAHVLCMISSYASLSIPSETCTREVLDKPSCAPDAGEFTGAIRAVQGIVRREGARGLFAGYGSFLLRDLPFDAIEFMAYEQLKKAYKVSSDS